MTHHCTFCCSCQPGLLVLHCVSAAAVKGPCLSQFDAHMSPLEFPQTVAGIPQDYVLLATTSGLGQLSTPYMRRVIVYSIAQGLVCIQTCGIMHALSA